MKKLIRITTVPVSLEKLLENQLSFMKEFYYVMAVSADKENLERVGALQQVPVYYLELTRKITPVADLKALWKLYRFLKKEKPFIVHSHTPKAGTIGMIAARLAGVPHRLHTVAGLPLMEERGNKRKLLDVVEKVTYSCATRIYPNSKGLYDIIVKAKFCNPVKLKVIGEGSSNGIDTARFSADNFDKSAGARLKTGLNIQPGDFVFVFVGRLVSHKGINELVSAYKALYSEHSHVKLLLVGAPEENLDPLDKETITAIEHHPGIIAVGHQPDVRPYFAISDALVFPSYREGFPNVVMQAGAMGLPSIATNINGCNEIIIEGINGTLVPPKNIKELLHAMSTFIMRNDYLQELASNARPMIISRYEQRLVWEAILKEYRSLEQYV